MGRLITVLIAFVFLASGCGSVSDGEQDQGQDGQDPAEDVQIGGVALSASADQVEVGGNDTTELTATVTDTSGDPVSGQTVTFTRTGPNQPGAGNYSGTGPTVTSSFTAAGGPTTFTLSHTGQSNYIVVLWNATIGERVTGLANEIGQVEREQVVNLTANNEYFLAVEEADGNWEISVEEGQVSPGGEQSLGQAQTNDKGEATLTYTSTEDAGDFQIQALAGTDEGAPQDTVSITQTPGDPAQVTLTTPDDLYANGGNQGDVRALVRDEYGNRVADGTTVDFSSSGNGGLSAETADTEDGVARVQLEAPRNPSEGLEISAELNDQAVASKKTDPFQDFTLSKPAVDPVSGAEDEYRVVVFLKDADNEVVGGKRIRFGTDGGRLASSTAFTSSDTGEAGVPLLDPPQGTEVTARFGDITKSTILRASLNLISDRTQIPSDGSESAQLTALVKDNNNNVVEGEEVSFEADSGALTVGQPTTDASGQAIAQLSPGQNRKNRSIVVTASSRGVADSREVEVVGTDLSVDGPTSLVTGDSGTWTVTLQDAGGDGIANRGVEVSSANGNQLLDTEGNPLEGVDLETDRNGTARFQMLAEQVGADTLTVSALNMEAEASVEVSGESFAFTEPAEGTDLALNTDHNLTVHWENPSGPVSGQSVDFSTTRGTISPDSQTTDANGDATVSISAPDVGLATITANAQNGPSVQQDVEFVATEPAKINVQADPAKVGIEESSTITAVVRDANNNLVKNQRVTFNLKDITGGTLEQPSAVTDSLGRASTVYTASSSASRKDGVDVTASFEENGTTAEDTVSLTVAEQALRITLGRGGTVTSPNDTRYEDPWTLLVTDAAGNPVDEEEVDLILYAEEYRKGEWEKVDVDGDGAPEKWDTSISSGECRNEDLVSGNPDFELNGILDPGEDLDGDGILEPGNPATTVPDTVTTDANGFADFMVAYPKSQAPWARMRLEARTTVDGTEHTETTSFVLPFSADDVGNPDVTPAGGTESPWGVAGDCTDPD